MPVISRERIVLNDDLFEVIARSEDAGLNFGLSFTEDFEHIENLRHYKLIMTLISKMASLLANSKFSIQK